MPGNRQRATGVQRIETSPCPHPGGCLPESASKAQHATLATFNRPQEIKVATRAETDRSAITLFSKETTRNGTGSIVEEGPVGAGGQGSKHIFEVTQFRVAVAMIEVQIDAKRDLRGKQPDRPVAFVEFGHQPVARSA